MIEATSHTPSRTRRPWPAMMLAALALLMLSPATLQPQVRAEYDTGTLGLLQSLLRLQTTASVMHIGAHPDDEDSGLIARLARGDHARIAYLSLNRGEGGQNTIGPEQSDALGVIRTEELLQARRLDGAQQLFTRTLDFGFSKTQVESAAFWDQETVLDDMVRAIRTFRPLVVISRFTGTPADGHGHHQLAGFLTPIAVRRASDPAAFPAQLAEGLRPWKVLKLYISTGNRAPAAGEVILRVDTGTLDPLLGRSYYEIAMEGRSLHRTQHQGALELRGDRTSGVRLVESAVTAAPADPLLTGIDTSITGLARLAGAPAGTLGADLAAVESAVGRALAAFKPLSPGETLPFLAGGLEGLRAAQDHLGALSLDPSIRAELTYRLDLKAHDVQDAAERAAGLVVDAIADRETAAPGESLSLAVRTFFPSGAPVEVSAARIIGPDGWRVEPVAVQPNAGNAGGFPAEAARRSEQFRVTVPADARATQPYWLTVPRAAAAMYNWPADSPKGLPFSPAILQAEVDARIGGVSVTIRRPVEFRVADPVRGELRRRIDVVPSVSVGASEPLMIVPTGSRATRRDINIQVENLSHAPVDGFLTLSAPAGWTITPPRAPFSIAATGERQDAHFTVDVPAATRAGEYSLDAEAIVGARSFAQTLETVAYPHIQTHRLYTQAAMKVQVEDLKVPAVRVGYVMGTGDEVASAIRLMGLPVTLLDSDALTTGDLSRYDTIVIGIRASEVRPDFVANHKRLLRFVEDGGALIVQYQQPDYLDRKLPPFPASMAARVTDEQAPVTLLVPDHPAFTTPNRIVPGDWSGWIQERSVNTWTTFDPRYTPLLESHDPGEPPQQGGEVIAQLGRGVYVYTAYDWFRELPAGVPGAYRLFANLLALGQRQPPAPPAAGANR